ncbi:MAG: response regulator transcription factor [Atopobiaceae bacterium]|nr:response regulator transcription factor [Atopobiaceae bacterium]
MQLSIAIVDDLKLDRERLSGDLRSYFARRPDLDMKLTEFESAEQLMEAYQPGAFDVLFLDILMGGLNGIQLAGKLREIDQKVLIIFLTSSPEFAFDAFPVHPFDYLMKPYEYERLEAVLAEVLHALSAEEPIISIRVPRDTHEVPLNKLVAIESRGHTVEVHLSDGQTLRSIMTFAEIEKILADDPRFLRCNRGVIVNMDQVLRLDGDVFKMRDGTIFPLRVRNRSALVSKFSQYTISRMEGR